MIIEKINQYLQSQIKQYPCHTNRASEIGHPCERYLVFNRTRWREKEMHDVSLEYIFREGREQEKSVLRLMAEAGFDVVEQQRPFDWKEYQITGSIDGKVLIDGEALPLEIKSCAPWIWDKINTLDDLLNAKYDHLRKYPAQLSIYMLCDNKDKAIFIFKNKSTGHLKELLMHLDLDYAEGLIQKAERVNLAVAEKRTPDPIDWCETCDRCGYRAICLNDCVREELEIIVDQEMEDNILGWFLFKGDHQKWLEYDEYRKEKFRGISKLVCGDFLITGKKIGENGWKTVYTKL